MIKETRVGTRWVAKNNDLREIEDYNLAFSSPDYQNLMIYDKGIVTEGSTINHSLGYAPSFDAYIKDGNKYFINTAGYAMTDYEMEAPSGSAIIGSNKSSLNIQPTLGISIAYLIYANSLNQEDGLAIPSDGTSGIKFSKKRYSLLDGIGRRSFDTDYQMPLVIKSYQAEVVLPEIIVANNSDVQRTAYVDIAHHQKQANHIIAPMFFDQAVFALMSPYASGFPPLRSDYSNELYVDDNKIRFRISGHYFNYAGTGAHTFPEYKQSINIYLTNIALPK